MLDYESEYLKVVLKILKKGSFMVKKEKVLPILVDSGSIRECILTKQMNFQNCTQISICHLNVSFKHSLKCSG